MGINAEYMGTITLHRNRWLNPVFTELLRDSCPVKDKSKVMRDILKRIEELTPNFAIPSEQLNCQSLRNSVANHCKKSTQSNTQTQYKSTDACHAFDLAMCMVSAIDHIHETCRATFAADALEQESSRILGVYKRFISLHYPSQICKYM